MMSGKDYRDTTSTFSNGSRYRSGYDLPLTGKAEGYFIQLHATALICIFLSLLSAVVVVVKSFKSGGQNEKPFFLRSKSERFIVYLALCDGFFSVSHSTDHLHILMRQDHVRPLQLCRFYAFIVIEFFSAQILMVNVVAINAFFLIFFKKNISFGKYDWKLLLWMFGIPFCIGMISLIFDQLGPTGAFCFYDGVKGKTAELMGTTIPAATMMVLNITLYFITWNKLREEEPRFGPPSGGGGKASVGRGSQRAVRNMTMFVLAFILQWFSLVVYGICVNVTTIVPLYLVQCVTVLSNIGGILNGVVFVIIRHQRLQLGSSNGS